MADDERLLASFCDADEELRDTWTVNAVQRGVARTPPQAGEDLTVGVTDYRLLWFDDELQTVALAAVEGVERDTVAHREAPWMVRAGSAAMIVGLATTVTSMLLSQASLPIALVPVVVGTLAFVGTILVARHRGLAGPEHVLHRLQIDEGGRRVTIWGPAEPIAGVADAVSAGRDDVAGTELR